MKKYFLFLTIAFMLIAISVNAQQTNSCIDARDGKTYKTVTIATQTWMAENLDYATSIGSWCYNNDSSNCSKYGRLYNWETAKTVCPSGWHLPSDAEWKTLAEYLGGKSVAGGKLKSIEEWDGIISDTPKEIAFLALPSGYRTTRGKYKQIGIDGFWWTASDYDATYAWSRGKHISSSSAVLENYYGDNEQGFCVRCLKD